MIRLTLSRLNIYIKVIVHEVFSTTVHSVCYVQEKKKVKREAVDNNYYFGIKD